MSTVRVEQIEDSGVAETCFLPQVDLVRCTPVVGRFNTVVARS